MKTAILVIDIGNTSTTLGVYRGGRVIRMDRVPTADRAAAGLERRLKRLAGSRAPEGVGVASVVPAAVGAWRKAARRLWPAAGWLEVGHRLELGVGIDYPRPATIGADRLCNACAAVERYGAPVIVVDFGTAVTFDVVSPERKYIGGIIAPGLPLMFSYLAEKTALLPRIEWGRGVHPVGRSTVEAMRLGAIWGYRGLVREIKRELAAGFGWKNVTYCATGGYAARIMRGTGLAMRIDRDLTLFGIGRIYELNQVK
ncbi:MAG TPA: type III pantothenate kinase [Kiritimatiellia bacterium]|nr:type III pantothenate kinase [Kiritimatiellia bacterium]HRZ12008.1 type III pantothenate kinase [Kiritimatiellia bacterium]HSA17186.1 type III pantothenate kinase [Kiritimatiellia bacterium]